MKTLLLLLFFIGAFLVMDASHREALSVAVRDAEARGRGDTRYRLPRGDEIIDLQFSHRAQEFGSIFDSSGPWAYRSDVAVPAAKKGGASGASAGAASGAASEAAAGAARSGPVVGWDVAPTGRGDVIGVELENRTRRPQKPPD